jgi:uncharacterized membrane protein
MKTNIEIPFLILRTHETAVKLQQKRRNVVDSSVVHPYILFMIETLMRACAAGGAMIAIYFVTVTYGIIRPDVRWIPSFCRVDELTCMRIIRSPMARVLGIPNAVVGLAYYTAIIVLPLDKFLVPILVASIFSVGLGMYLTHVLLKKLRIMCTLCFTAHIINLVIANLLIIVSLGG